MKKIKVCFYGSLREGLYNNSRIRKTYGEDSIVKLSTHSIPGFELHSFGSYPGAFHSEKGIIVVECFECDENAYRGIRSMELGAGYSEELVKIEDEAYIIYVIKDDRYKQDLVESGDWFKFVKEKQQKYETSY